MLHKQRDTNRCQNNSIIFSFASEFWYVFEFDSFELCVLFCPFFRCVVLYFVSFVLLVRVRKWHANRTHFLQTFVTFRMKKKLIKVVFFSRKLLTYVNIILEAPLREREIEIKTAEAFPTGCVDFFTSIDWTMELLLDIAADEQTFLYNRIECAFFCLFVCWSLCDLISFQLASMDRSILFACRHFHSIMSLCNVCGNGIPPTRRFCVCVQNIESIHKHHTHATPIMLAQTVDQSTHNPYTKWHKHSLSTHTSYLTLNQFTNEQNLNYDLAQILYMKTPMLILNKGQNMFYGCESWCQTICHEFHGQFSRYIVKSFAKFVYYSLSISRHSLLNFINCVELFSWRSQ